MKTILTVLALVLLASPAMAQRDIPGCNSVVEWRYEGQGETWDSKPLVCVPDNGQINLDPKPKGAHYRVRRGLMISLFTTDSGLADAGGCRDLAADGARQGHGLFDAYLGDWYWAYIMPGWHVSMTLGTCEQNSIPPCDPGICGEWH